MKDLNSLIEIAVRDMEKHMDRDQDTYSYGYSYSYKNDNIIKTLKEAMQLAYEAGQEEAYKRGREDERYFTRGPSAIKPY